jgi:hypothetical protein
MHGLRDGGQMRTWIFQGNPDDFDIDGYLATQPVEFPWLVTRYAADIAVGDRVVARVVQFFFR